MIFARELRHLFLNFIQTRLSMLFSTLQSTPFLTLYYHMQRILRRRVCRVHIIMKRLAALTSHCLATLARRFAKGAGAALLGHSIGRK